MSDAHAGSRRREADWKMSFARTTRSDNANALSELSMRRSLLAPASLVDSANIDCAAVAIARRIQDKSRSPPRQQKLPNDRHRVPRP